MFATAPVLLKRIGLHTALASRWILLCAIRLYLSSRTARPWAWMALLFVSVPAYHAQPERSTFAWFAARHGLGSNIGYFGRTNPALRPPAAR